MIGLALVTLVATLAAGITQTFRGAVNDIFSSDYAITAQNNYSPIPVSVGETAAKAPGVTAVGSVRTGETNVFGETTYSTAVDAADKDVVTLVWKDGSQDVLATLGATARSSTTGTPTTTTSRSARPSRSTFVTGKTDVHGEGHLRPADRRLAVRPRDHLGETWDAENPQPKDLFSFLKVAGGESDGEPGGDREDPRRATRTRRCRRASSSSTTRSRASTRS